MPESDNPLERGTVGKTSGNTLVTNYAWVEVDIDGVKITNIPLKGDENIEKEHALHASGFNCFVKSFTCNRAVPKGVKGFWNNAGGGMECSLSVFDPTFIQFEQLVMENVKNQKVHCKVSYGISNESGGSMPAPFVLNCLITKMNESVTAAGAEWDLTLNTTPPEFFDVYPEKGKEYKKETVYKLGNKTEYKRVSDLVKKLLEEENWKGIVIRSKELKKGEMKIPTKDFSSRIDLIRLKLAPMAQCEDDNRQDPYQLLVGLDGAVYFMPFGMTIKDALESKLASSVNNFNINSAKEEQSKVQQATKETIEQLNMRDYVSEDNGMLTLKYGFKNSVVKSFNITYEGMSMVTQYWYKFKWKDKNQEIHTFEMPELSEKQQKELNKSIKNNTVFLWETNEEDAKEAAKTIIRKLHIVDYNGSATLVNWPYIMPMQQITFEYMIPSGSKMSLIGQNTNKQVDTSGLEKQRDELEQKRLKAIKQNSKSSKKLSDGYQTSMRELDSQIKHYNDQNNERMKSKRSKLKTNAQISQSISLEENNAEAITPKISQAQYEKEFKQNVGIPTTLGSWSDTHKSSITYLVCSIKDTIEGGIILSELELKALFADQFPQLNESMKR